jgi:hypothetical protein
VRYHSDYLKVIPHMRLSERFSGTSHLLIVVLVAALAAVFPAEISAHSSAVQAAAPPAAHSLPVTAVRSIQRQSGPNRWTPATHVHMAAPVVTTKKVRPAKAATTKKTVAAPPSATVHVVSVATPQPSAIASEPGGYGCTAALSYLQAHAAPGFSFECPGYAEGHQAMTCVNVAGVCPGAKLIAISIPCAAAYMNESSNSWVLSGKSDAPIDPYGYCD